MKIKSYTQKNIYVSNTKKNQRQTKKIVCYANFVTSCIESESAYSKSLRIAENDDMINETRR